MNITGISDFLDKNYTISDMTISSYSSNMIDRETIRTKGQFPVQRLMYIIGGTTKFILNNSTTIIASEGDIIYFPPDTTYTSYWADNPENEFAVVRFNIFSEGQNLLLSEEMKIIKHDVYKTYHKDFTMLCNYYYEGCLGYKIKCHSILLNIIFSLIPEFMQFSNSIKNSKIHAGILFIENNYLKKINVNQVAKMCSMCPTAFRKQFHDITGMSPIDYKNYLIAKKAAELLKSGEYNISEASEAVGIDNIYYFNRLFKKYFHIPPGKYQTAVLSETLQNQKH